MPRLSILTLTVPDRAERLAQLSAEIGRQITRGPFEAEHVICADDGSLPYGAKMTLGLRSCTGDYVSVVDDDDLVAGCYVAQIFEALDRTPAPDVVTFRALRTDTGEVWRFRYREPDGTPIDGGRVMSANHYCAWRTSIARESVWLPMAYWADVCWYGLLTAAFPNLHSVAIPAVLYLYRFDPSDSLCQGPEVAGRSVQRCQGGLDGWRDRITGRLYLSSLGRDLQTPGSVLVMNSEGQESSVPPEQLEHIFSTEVK